MTDSPVPSPAPPDKEVHGIFSSQIDQSAVSRVANAVSVFSGNGVTRCHMAFQTSGGSVPDGVALYNIFKTFTIPLTLYNIGSVSSAGILAYLGAFDRAASSLSTFMIHRTMSPAFGMTSDRLRAAVRSVEIDDDRTEEILKAVSLTQEHREVHKIADLWLASDEAKTVGLVTRIAEFGPPKGTQMFYLGPV